MTDPARLLVQLEAKAEELRELVREANGTLKDIRSEYRRVEELIARGIENEVAARLQQELTTGLAEFSMALETAIQDATAAVYDRFDLIAGIALGEDWHSQQEGKEPLAELVRRYIALKGPVT